MCTVLHQITLCFFLLNPCQSQSGPPGQIMRAGSLITADISLAKFRWNVGVFSQTFRSHKNLDCSTLSHISEVKQSHSWILKNKTSEQGGKHRRGTHTHTLQGPGSSFRLFLVYVGPVYFVKQTGLELVTLDLILGLWPAATHSTHQPLKYRRESDLSATSSPPHVPVRSLPQPCNTLTSPQLWLIAQPQPGLLLWHNERGGGD